jgi:hypothetical protein
MNLWEAVQYINKDTQSEQYHIVLDSSQIHHVTDAIDIKTVKKSVEISTAASSDCNDNNRAVIVFGKGVKKWQLLMIGKIHGIECRSETDDPVLMNLLGENIEVNNCNLNNVSIHIAEHCHGTVTNNEFAEDKNSFAIYIDCAHATVTNNYIHDCIDGIKVFHWGYNTDYIVHEIGIPSSSYSLLLNNRIIDCSGSGMKIEYGYANESQYNNNTIEKCDIGITHIVESPQSDTKQVDLTMRSNHITYCNRDKEVYIRQEPEW